MQNNKIRLRKTFMEQRRLFTSPIKHHINHLISQQVLSYMIKHQVTSCGVFVNTPDEPDTTMIIDFALKNKIQVFLPCLENNHMNFRRINDLDDLVQHAHFTLKQPKSSCKILTKPNQLPVIFVPLVAFDTQLNRIGSGYGYYDRWFLEHDYQGVKIGICQAAQQTQELIDYESHDVRLDVIITEKAVIKPAK